MCRKPHSTLATALERRKSSGGFSNGEVARIVDRVCIAVKQLVSMAATVPAISPKNVFMA